MLLPYLPAEGRVAAAIDAVIARRGGRSAYFAPHARALLAPGGERASYLERAIDRKKRKELRRQRNRLADRGSVSTHVASSPSAVASALDDFFALEARGWKGRAGTAARRTAMSPNLWKQPSPRWPPRARRKWHDCVWMKQADRRPS